MSFDRDSDSIIFDPGLERSLDSEKVSITKKQVQDLKKWVLEHSKLCNLIEAAEYPEAMISYKHLLNSSVRCGVDLMNALDGENTNLSNLKSHKANSEKISSMIPLSGNLARFEERNMNRRQQFCPPSQGSASLCTSSLAPSRTYLNSLKSRKS